MDANTLSVEVKNIPDVLKQRRAWVGWRYETHKGRRTKIPYNVKTERWADPTDAGTWVSFEDAYAKYNAGGYDGIGYVFSEDDPFFGVDFDNCIVDKRIAPEVKAILDRCKGAYAELSPSLAGVKLWGVGKFNDRGRRKESDWKNGAIELYQTERFFTVTGAQVRGNGAIGDCQSGADFIYEKYFAGNRNATQPSKLDGKATQQSVALSDDQILEKCRRARNAAKFSELFNNGNGEGISESEVDAALIGILAFYTDDVDQIERLIRRSPLVRDKWDEKRGDTTWIRYTIENIIAKGGARWTPPSVTVNPSGYGLCASDADARRFREMFKGRWLYCKKLDAWLYYDGVRWVLDEIGIITQYALQVRAWIRAEAKLAKHDKNVAEEFREKNAFELHKWATNLGNRGRVRELLFIAQSLPGMYVTPDELDANAMFLNCLNKTLDLGTGELRDHDPADRITQLCPVVCDLKATSDVLDKFINDITGVTSARTPEEVKQATEFREYLKCCVGMTLSARATKTHWIGFVLGPSGTGKSTAANVLLAGWGDYGTSLDFEVIAKKRNDVDLQPKLKQIRGKRLMIINEVGSGRQIDVALMNKISGGDKINPRTLHERNPEAFRVVGKPWLFANNRFSVTSAEDGFWRRLRVLRFDFKPEKENEDLEETLQSPEHLSAMLAWAVEGWKSYQEHGLQTPQCVKKWTQDFRGFTNPVPDFLAALCVPGSVKPDDKELILNSEMYETFTRWIKHEGRNTDIRDIKGLWNVISQQPDYNHIQQCRAFIGRGYRGIKFDPKRKRSLDMNTTTLFERTQ